MNEYKVEYLQGPTDAWVKQLNSLAEQRWTLVCVDDGIAYLVRQTAESIGKQLGES